MIPNPFVMSGTSTRDRLPLERPLPSGGYKEVSASGLVTLVIVSVCDVGPSV